MNAEEQEIYEFLKRDQYSFLSVLEISRCLGSRGRYNQDRAWARPYLRRMELDGLVESNHAGEYRLKEHQAAPGAFIRAVARPGAALGDTTIITLQDGAKENAA